MNIEVKAEGLKADDKLPQGWINIGFMDVLDIQGGTQPPKKDFIYEEKEDYIRLLQIRDFGDKPLATYIPIQKKLKICSKNDILIGRYGASVGRICTGMEGAYNVALAKVIVPEEINKQYIYFLLESHIFQREILSTQRSAQDGFNKDDLTKINIPIAPLNEQKRIVAKLEKLLAKVNESCDRLSRIPTILKRFRQSVLASACSGRLTADWRKSHPDIEPAEELLKRIQEERIKRYEEECTKAKAEGRRKPKDQDTNKRSSKPVIELPEIPSTWSFSRLEQISYLVTDGTHKTPKYQDEGVSFLSVKNVRPFLIQDQDIKYISKDEYKEINSRCNPEKGDILYTKVGATFGYAALNNLDYPFSIFVSLALIKPVHPLFNSEYAEIIMNSEIVFAQARDRISGIGTPDLHLIEIRDFRIPLPPLEEQKEIVRRVEALFRKCDLIEQRYLKAKAYTDKLTQSILAKAFRGELVPQDSNDEPAEVLLERIREEKALTDKSSKSKTSKHKTS